MDKIEWGVGVGIPVALITFCILMFSGIIPKINCDNIGGDWVEYHYPNGRLAYAHCEYQLTATVEKKVDTGN